MFRFPLYQESHWDAMASFFRMYRQALENVKSFDIFQGLSIQVAEIIHVQDLADLLRLA